jgi:predicted aldo/keto reductase-like oxidoreductase
MYGIKDKENIKLFYLNWSLHDKAKEMLDIIMEKKLNLINIQMNVVL